MKLFVFIALIAILGCSLAINHGHMHHHRRLYHWPQFRPHQRPHHPFPRYHSWPHSTRPHGGWGHPPCGYWGCQNRPNFPTWTPPVPFWPQILTTQPTLTVETTTMSREQCKVSCPTTNEYNPVCGTNNVTYDNLGRLQCAQTCGVNVNLQFKSACPPITNIVDNNNGTSSVGNGTSPKTNSLPPTEHFKQCMKSCPTTSTIGHVCGTDRETYLNIDRLKCAKECGKEVEVLCEQACILCSDPKPTTTVSTPTKPTVENTTVSTEQCINICLQEPEYQPVCGTNNVTYNNIAHLQCAQICGENVNVLCKQRCEICNLSEQTEMYSSTSTSRPTTVSDSTSTSNPTITSNSTSTSKPITISNATSTLTQATKPKLTVEASSYASIKECIEACPPTSEYDPVCGSNNVTYNNPTHIVCAQVCGEDVTAVWFSTCSDVIVSSTPPSLTSDITNKSSSVESTSSSSTTTDSVDVTTEFDDHSLDPR